MRSTTHATHYMFGKKRPDVSAELFVVNNVWNKSLHMRKGAIPYVINLPMFMCVEHLSQDEDGNPTSAHNIGHSHPREGEPDGHASI